MKTGFLMVAAAVVGVTACAMPDPALSQGMQMQRHEPGTGGAMMGTGTMRGSGMMNDGDHKPGNMPGPGPMRSDDDGWARHYAMHHSGMPSIRDGMMRDGMMGPGMMGPGMMAPGMMMYGDRSDMDFRGPGGRDARNLGFGSRVRPRIEISVDDVTAHFQDRLEALGNKRLKLGDVKEGSDDTITADVVTVDNSLVQRFSIDRRTGAMTKAE